MAAVGENALGNEEYMWPLRVHEVDSSLTMANWLNRLLFLCFLVIQVNPDRQNRVEKEKEG